jgi:hypothetical protein
MLSRAKFTIPDWTRRIPLPSDGSVSIAGRSPGLVAAAVEAVVTLPTFKRPEQLLATLASLKGQQTGRRFAVIIMENEAEARAGAKAALPLFERGDIAGMVIVAHERGNCSAYNAGWQTAILHFPAFRHLLVIDDDEIADPHWLERMCKAAETLSADIVGGPQVPCLPTRPMQDGPRTRSLPRPTGRPGLCPRSIPPAICWSNATCSPPWVRPSST